MVTSLEQIYSSRFDMNTAVQRVNADRSAFIASMHIALSDKSPEGWRAAWVLGHSVSKNDLRLPEFTDLIIKAIDKKKDGHQRELLMLVFKIKLNEKQEGQLFDTCVTIWEQVNKSSSVRYFAFNFIFETIKKYPDLKSEIDFLTQPEYVSTLSPGIRIGVEKKIQKLNLKG